MKSVLSLNYTKNIYYSIQEKERRNFLLDFLEFHNITEEDLQ